MASYPMFGSQQSYKATYSVGTTQDPILMKVGDNKVAVALVPTAGTMNLQYTLFPQEDIEADPTACTWTAWSAGAVGAYTEGSLTSPVTAIRIVLGGGGAGTIYLVR